MALDRHNHPKLNEAGLEAVPHASHTPEQSRGILQILGQIPTNIRALLVLATLGSVANVQTGCSFGESQVDTAEDQVLLAHQEKDWKFNMYRTGKSEVSDEHGETLYHFIKGILEDADVFEGMENANKQKVIDAMIYFCRSLNSENLDDFQGINGKTLYFPESIYVTTPDGKGFLLDLDFKLSGDKDEELKEGLGDRGGDVEITKIE